jgi:hypothetical protein
MWRTPISIAVIGGSTAQKQKLPMTAKVGENMAECARMIEAHYFKGPYVLGQALLHMRSLSGADFSLAKGRWREC